MLCTNHYTHCGIDWEDDDCDSFHNDHCPVCGKEIEPHKSVEYTDEGEKTHYHKVIDHLI
jgi:hypothetical protein